MSGPDAAPRRHRWPLLALAVGSLVTLVPAASVGGATDPDDTTTSSTESSSTTTDVNNDVDDDRVYEHDDHDDHHRRPPLSYRPRQPPPTTTEQSTHLGGTDDDRPTDARPRRIGTVLAAAAQFRTDVPRVRDDGARRGGSPARCLETRLVQYGYWLAGPNDTFDTTVWPPSEPSRPGKASRRTACECDHAARPGDLDNPPAVAAPTCKVYVSVRLSSRGVVARCVETRLRQFGYWLSGPDDNFDATAVNALKIFQDRNGLAADGIAGTQPFGAEHLDDAAECRRLRPCFTSWNVRAGDVGYPARCIETRLRQYGYWLVADDRFDATSVNALRIFQSRHGLPSTGIADYHTMVRLGVWKAPGFPAASCRPTTPSG